MGAARAEFVNDMYTFSLKMVNSLKKNQFLSVHYHNYMLCTKYNTCHKEKTSLTYNGNRTEWKAIPSVSNHTSD